MHPNVIRFLLSFVSLTCLWASPLLAEDLRVWHDQNGQEIRAILRKVEGDKVLMLKDGKEFLFHLSILSDEDQAYVREWAARSSRSFRGLLALYDFGLAEGSTVKDVSGVEPALDLQIVNPKGVKRTKGSLEISGKTMIRSIKVPTKIIKTVKGSGELTVEAWVRSANLKQNGPARILTISKDTSNRNFTLGQDGSKYDLRLRTSKTSRNGMPSLASPANGVTTKLTHLAYSRERGGKADPGGEGIDITLEELTAEWRLLADLYAFAIQTDRARFGAITFLAAGERIRLKGTYRYAGRKIFDFDDAGQHRASGAKGCSHEWWHKFNEKKTNEELRAHVHMKMREVAYFLSLLAGPDAREANGKTILENSLFTMSTESGDGRHNDIKRELSGVFHAITSAGGLFKTGRILDLKAEAIDVYNTMLTTMGAKRRLGDTKRKTNLVNQIRA